MPRIEAGEIADDETAAERGVDGDVFAGIRCQPRKIGSGLRLETCAAMRDERNGRPIRITHARRAANGECAARKRASRERQTFSGSVVVLFFNSAGTGRP